MKRTLVTALVSVLVIFGGCITNAQNQNPFIGKWAVQIMNFTYGDGNMDMVITPDGGYLDQKGTKVDLKEVKVSGNNLKAEYEAMGYNVTFYVNLLSDGTLRGSLMDMFDITGKLSDGNAVSSASAASSYNEVSSEDFKGTWYGLYSGSPLTLSADGKTLEIVSDAFSSMNMTCGYTLRGGNPTRISVEAGASGMAGEGICAIENGNLDILLIFGVPGQVQVPKDFSDGATNPSASHFTLSRDRSVIDKVTVKVDAPAEAALAFERNARLGKGVNLNGVLDSQTENKPMKSGTAKAIAKAGFSSVRIPVRWGDHTAKAAPYTIDPDFIKKVDAIIDECLSEGLAVNIDNHYYPVISFGFGPQDLSFEENIDRLYSIWKQLSAHYKNYSDETLFFELMNEPSLSLPPSQWNEIVSQCVKIIRVDNPGKTILVTTPSLGQHWTIGLLEFPDDWNIIVDAHYYLPQTFTHQGLSYAMAEGLEGTPWNGTDADKAPLDQDFAFLSRWSERTSRPVNIGEYGVCANADEISKARYLKYISSLMRKYGFSSHLWAFHRDTFGIYDENTGKWNESMLKAIKSK